MSGDHRDPHHLFVYGTLRPGDVRWPLLAPWVSDDGIADRVDGQLFDTGLGYPAAIFDRPGTIVGVTYGLRTATIQDALAALDDEEDTVLGLYQRVVVTTSLGIRAWAYQYGSGLTLTAITTGDWLTR